MAGVEQQHKDQQIGGEEVKDRGMFDFMGKKKENECHDQEVIVTEFDKVKVEEEKKAEEEEKKKEEHHHKLHGSDSSSSSSEEEEEGENGEKKKKKKKGLKEKIKEKISGEKKEGEEEEKKGDTNVTVEKVDCTTQSLSSPVENKGFLDKIKKLPGHSPKKTTEETVPPSQPVPVTPAAVLSPPPAAAKKEPEGAKEKKGFLGKIMDKIPGYHKSNNEPAEQVGDLRRVVLDVVV